MNFRHVLTRIRRLFRSQFQIRTSASTSRCTAVDPGQLRLHVGSPYPSVRHRFCHLGVLQTSIFYLSQNFNLCALSCRLRKSQKSNYCTLRKQPWLIGLNINQPRSQQQKHSLLVLLYSAGHLLFLLHIQLQSVCSLCQATKPSSA